MTVLEALAILEAAVLECKKTRGGYARVTGGARFSGAAHSTGMAHSTVSPQPRRRARTRVCCAGRSTASISRYVFRDQKFSPSANRKAGSNGFLNSQYNTIAWTSRNGIRKHIPAITTKKNHPQGA